MSQQLDGRTVLVTGANGGLGAAFVSQALELGAARVYAAARRPREYEDSRVIPLELDLTSPATIAAAAELASDVDLLVNNAGMAHPGDSILDDEELIRDVFETNFFGTLRVAKAFAPILSANGGGTMINILSVASWLPMPTGYAASKAALTSATNSLRLLLGPNNTQVIAVQVGMIDTPMGAAWDIPKVSPESVVSQSYDAVTNGSLEVLADDTARTVKSQMNLPAEQFYPPLHAQILSAISTKSPAE